MSKHCPQPSARCVRILANVLTAAAAATLAASAQAGPVSITDPVTSYVQDFDTLPSTGSSVTFTGGTTIEGWYVFNARTGASSPVSVPSLLIGTGSANTVAAYDFGSAGSSDRALGAISLTSSGGVQLFSSALAMTNNTGNDLAGITLLYDAEQWRNGGSGRADNVSVQYGFGTSFASVTWSNTGATFTAAAPITGTSAGALDGNLAANRRPDKGGRITANWLAGATMWVRWVDSTPSINVDNGLAIDNVRIGFTPVTVVPEPATYVSMAAGLALLAGVAAWRRRGD